MGYFKLYKPDGTLGVGAPHPAICEDYRRVATITILESLDYDRERLAVDLARFPYDRTKRGNVIRFHRHRIAAQLRKLTHYRTAEIIEVNANA